MEWFGDKAVHTTEGTVEDVDKGTKTAAVKTADGSKETFAVAGHATAIGAKKGEHVTVPRTILSGKPTCVLVIENSDTTKVKS